ncbi:rho GTPase-activating protein 19-like protein [Leptotrombidium deliense]|uniref:Rho GTPase-activating protein 19-like protein n=1 Tax=Leptotrombidium deliense TaxID=299467 RepID=A0A443SHU4_9ACAR|nr:rho GTPase-activating protein 19-like protein [Leptotrombidium deliense]
MNETECDIVEKLRIKNETALHELVKMHLSFALDLHNDNFETLFDSHPLVEKSKQNPNGSKKLKNDDGIFHCELTEEGICRLYILIDFIVEDINITQEGIFRKCGSAVRQQELKYKLSHGTDVDLNSGEFTVHDCANVLKACLAELPEPLLTDIHFKLHHIISDLISPSMSPTTRDNAQKKRLRILQLFMLLLPTSVRKFVQNLILMLHKVTQNCEQNKMDSRSLATLFSPHLLCPKNLTAKDMQKYSGVLSDELQFMIDNVEELFQPPKELITDVLIELKKCNEISKSTDNVLDTAYSFCERKAGDKNYTEIELAVLYAQLHNMPDNPWKQKLLKRFNRQNGGLSPVAVKKSTPGKRVIKGIGNQLRKVGHNLFSRSPKQMKLNKETEEIDTDDDIIDTNETEQTKETETDVKTTSNGTQTITESEQIFV